jgi:hypothetical protein
VEVVSLESVTGSRSESDDDDGWLSNDYSEEVWPGVDASEFLSRARESLPFTFDRHGNLSFIPCPLDKEGKKSPHQRNKKVNATCSHDAKR